jgi:hypothetical protein
MPNRILRDWTFSKEMSFVSFGAEVLFIRLIQKADDFGRYFGDPEILLSQLFPKKGTKKIEVKQIKEFVAELEQQELITCYKVNGHQFILINDFEQRIRAKSSKFPEAPKQTVIIMNDLPEFEQPIFQKIKEPNQPITDKLEVRKQKFKESLSEHLNNYGKEILNSFYAYWSELNRSKTKMKFEMQATWELSKRLATWKRNENKFNKPKLENGTSAANTSKSSKIIQSDRQDFE